ncbi:hypothetical protein L198_05653 [Cryptococcus wingfieldii CBS 7118]|uniref:Uncharacterized protein n=1 Tax=Cryptococcus wingfieldii CBS 7118 TaxID=1295528 RepID=A0A1E3IY76_9TREE|nr:hypothetical protein L198_05653 [Cryptococcus wingfieldii CBS 7118]ODN92856.1 hypothetical protein L198_05653 [Cryptococcus wingfieldii CBS 7118]
MEQDSQRQDRRRDKMRSLQEAINSLNGSDPGTDFNKLYKTGVRELQERLRSWKERQESAGESSGQVATDAGSNMGMESNEEGVGASERGQSPATEDGFDWDDESVLEAMLKEMRAGLFFADWPGGNDFSG